MTNPIDHKFLDDCAKITSAYDSKMGGWSLDSQLMHIVSEVSELKDVMRNKNHKYGKPNSPEWYEKFYDELADVHLTVFSTDNFLSKCIVNGKQLKLSHDDLNKAILKKLKIVEERVNNIGK